MADRTLVVKLVGDEADLLRSYTRAGRATKKFGDTTDSSLAKTDKRFRNLKATGAGFAGGFIASEVFANLKTFIDKASESEAVLTQVRQGLRNTGQSWKDYGNVIDRTVDAQSRLGFDDEDLLQSFDKFNRQVGNVNKALRLNNLAMDVARGRSISLEAATTLVTKAQAGQRGALTRLGIEVDKNASKTELLRVLTEKYGGSAEAAADDAATAQQRLAVQLENVQETIGTALLPTVSRLADTLADGLVAGEGVARVLKTIGRTKVPVIDIPLNFKLPGSDKKLTDLLFKTNIFEVGKFAIDQIAGPDTGPRFGQKTAAQGVAAAAREVINARGIREPSIEVRVNLDGKEIGKSTTKQQQKTQQRNSRQKRGPNSAFR